MAKLVQVPWGAWYGDGRRGLSFPDSWQVQTYAMRDARDVGVADIAEALAHPIGTDSLINLANHRRSAVVVVDDLSRATPAARLLPSILSQIEDAGIPPKRSASSSPRVRSGLS